MSLHTLTQAIFLWRLYVLHLVLWVPLLFAIWLYWRLFVVYKVLITWILVRELNIGQVASGLDLLELLLQWQKLLL